MKKWIILLLVYVIILSLVACSVDNPVESTSAQQPPEEQAPAQAEVEPETSVESESIEENSEEVFEIGTLSEKKFRELMKRINYTVRDASDEAVSSFIETVGFEQEKDIVGVSGDGHFRLVILKSNDDAKIAFGIIAAQLNDEGLKMFEDESGIKSIIDIDKNGESFVVTSFKKTILISAGKIENIVSTLNMANVDLSPLLTPAEESNVQNFGTRKNPAQFGDEVIVTGEYYGVPYEYVITLSELIRGEEAIDRMKDDNQFNETKDNEEPIYFNVKFELVKYDDKDDNPYFISRYDFNYYKSDYGEYRTTSSIVVEDGLMGNIYEGATIEGTVGLIIPIDDNGYVLFNDNLWFQLPQNSIQSN